MKIISFAMMRLYGEIISNNKTVIRIIILLYMILRPCSDSGRRLKENEIYI